MPDLLHAPTIESVRTSLALHGLTYVHVGSLFGVQDVIENLSTAQSDQGGAVHLFRIGDDDFSSRLTEVADTFDYERANATTFILAGIECLADQRSEYVSSKLGSARATLMPILCSGHRLVVVSAVPRYRIRFVDRSNLLIDCHPVRAVRATLKEISAEAQSMGLESHHNNIFEKSAGFPQLARAYLTLSAESMSGNAKRRASELRTRDVLSKTIVELGPQLAAWLEDKVTSADRLQLHVEEVPSDIAEALGGAHLMDEADDGTVTFLRTPFQEILIDELRRYCRGTCDIPPGWGDLGGVIFQLERTLRSHVRALLADRIGSDWPTSLREWSFATESLFVDYGRQVDHGAVDVLAYTTLERLIEIALEHETNNLWRQLLREIVRDVTPIRNRFAHMRLLRAGDSATIRSIYRRLDALAKLRPGPVDEAS